MDPITIALIALRAVGTVFSMQGRPEISNTINDAITAYEAGKNVDAYMQEIADALNDGAELATWDDIRARINSEVDDFLDEGA